MNREQIKLTAIAAMTVNHTAIALVPPDSIVYTIMTDIGYLTAVTMCYFLIEVCTVSVQNNLDMI